MTPHEPPEPVLDEEHIKISLLDDEIEVRTDGLNRLWKAFSERLMRFLAYHHPGISVQDHADIILRSLERYRDRLPSKPEWEDRPIFPVIARIALLIGRDKYRSLSKQREREIDVMSSEIAGELKDTDLGAAWHAAETSTRQRITATIREVASTMKPRQRQIAYAFAQSWMLEHSEKEAIDFIFTQTGDRLTRDAYKRGWDEVRKKLQEPINRLLKEEGYART
jgi:hypothetical protein